MQTGDLNPAALPPGTRVGPWRVVAQQGRGMCGAVYRAVAAESEDSKPVALKLALYPRDERFAREAELLRRVQHPAVPRLLDAGEWRSSSGTPHPYIAMQFVEGMPLYDWVWQKLPSSRQALLLLASLARALAATHSVGGVHRDVKGGNVLVRASDGQPFLTDFGCGHYRGASTLTWQLLPPGTPAYRSPEAWRYALRANPDSAPAYPAGPADDVFALGVTAFRLLTGVYPPSTNPEEEESRVWHREGCGAPAVRELNARSCAELSALVRRMLSVQPEARGSARELAEALEQAARHVGPEAEAPLFERTGPRPMRVRIPARRAMPRVARRNWPPWLAAASLGGALALVFGWGLSVRSGKESAREQAVRRMEGEPGTVAVGDSALMIPLAPIQAPSAWSTVALEVPQKPFPGQRRPDADGRCPGEAQVPIRGGCWIKLTVDLKDCGKNDAFMYQGGCYMPVIPPARPPTSSPSQSPDHR